MAVEADERDLYGADFSDLYEYAELEPPYELDLEEWEDDSCGLNEDCLEHKLSGEQDANVISPGTLAYVARVRGTDTRLGESKVKRIVLHPLCADALLQGQRENPPVFGLRSYERKRIVGNQEQPMLYSLESDLYPVRIAGKRLPERQVDLGYIDYPNCEEDWNNDCEGLEEKNEESVQEYVCALNSDSKMFNGSFLGEEVEDPGPEPSTVSWLT